MNYESDIAIDETALDVEWLEQPALVLKYARINAEARRDLDYAKEELDVVAAELDKDIRLHPKDYGLEKVTEGAVSNTILLSDKWIEANHKYIEARYNQSMASEAYRAITDRKESLENLVRLFQTQYFAGPSVPRDLSKEWQDRNEQKTANKLVGAAMTRRRK